MYIYELPFNINKELCRLLDNDDDWKELAGSNRMNYSAFQINEIEQTARRLSISPTHQLLTQWAQYNHKVEELFILLYHMKHVPALWCLKPMMTDIRYHQLLNKLEKKIGLNEKNTCDVNHNRQVTEIVEERNSFIPLPVMHCDQLTTSNNEQTGTSPASGTSPGISKDPTSLQGGKESEESVDIMKNVPKMSYEDLTAATNNWSTGNVLGAGGFGKVYKGEWKHLKVAVKRLNRKDDGMNKELIREMCLNQYRHDNILPLYGYCLEGSEACLVYQLMAGGSLDKRIRGKYHPPLTWLQRYRIAHGVASGLQYLHNMAEAPLIHGDIKPGNILLDQCLTPKIGDFGLARKGPYGDGKSHLIVSTKIGTRAYLPEEYLRDRWLSPAIDVFSYGVVILEIATALLADDRTRTHHNLYNHIYAQYQAKIDLATLEDRTIFGTLHSNPQLCREFISIGLHCTNHAKRQRPTMLEVYKRLDFLEFPGKHLA